MAWHNFKDGEQYSLNRVVEVYEERIRSGKVADKDGKQKYLQQIRDCGQSDLLYRPKGKGWDNSPLNPNSWHTLEDKPISGASSVSEDTTPHE